MFTQFINNELGTGTLVGCELKCRNTRLNTHMHTHRCVFRLLSVSSSLCFFSPRERASRLRRRRECGIDVRIRYQWQSGCGGWCGGGNLRSGCRGATCSGGGRRRVEWMQGINVRIGCKGATCGADAERRRVEWMQRGHMWSECRGQCAK